MKVVIDMKLLYKIISKISEYLEEDYIKSKLNYVSDEAKKTVIIDKGVKILNPNVTLGKNVHLYYNVIIFGDGPIFIDDNVKIGFNTVIYSDKRGGINIGKRCSIAANSYIIDTNHSTQSIVDGKNREDTSELVIIGDDVWIGAECVISKGSILNNGVIVGANSFVNNKISENCIVAGSPARLIRKRE